MTEAEKFLIVGLGNPGREYRANRHNVGFMTLDRLAAKLGLAFTRRQSDALYTSGRLGGRPVVLAKPQRFMNLSGGPVASLVRFHNIAQERFIVVFDELDLPLGTLRLRPAGGTAGHRGMRSVVEALGTQDFPRLRFGIGRPPGRKDAAAHVLEDFNQDELPLVEVTLDRAVEALETFVTEGIVQAMNRFNAHDDKGVD
jgi:peptidyl-tRNA hydrolase, PTH1 family